MQALQFCCYKCFGRNVILSNSELRINVLNYLERMRIQDSIMFKFSPNSTVGDLYSTTYALLLYSLLNVKLEDSMVSSYIDYYDSHQSSDGLYRDIVLQTNTSEFSDHWGWRHLLPHILIALEYLGVKPRHNFFFIKGQLDSGNVIDWLENLDWSQNYLSTSNLIFNIAISLQYGRDNMNDSMAESILVDLKCWLVKNILSTDNIMKWYNSPGSKKMNIYKIVKTVYHILPILVYDKEMNKYNIEKVLDYALMTQNSIGGYGPLLFSDSCEDIDSAYIISILSKANSFQSVDSLKKHIHYIGINWDTINGGFMFRRGSRFQYGDSEILVTPPNQSNMFATWFRTLSIAFTCEYLEITNKFVFSKCPGYQFKRRNSND